MNKIKLIVLSFFAVVGIASVVVPSYALASPADSINQGVKDVGGAGEAPLGTRIQTVVNILLYILGAIAVIMIVIGGISYTTSNGDSGKIKTAKDTILYAVVGLVVAILAYAIVNFVIASF